MARPEKKVIRYHPSGLYAERRKVRFGPITAAVSIFLFLLFMACLFVVLAWLYRPQT